ncbi:MAG: hypothetical protein J3R72DRAFT_451738 [Linnemannia gamsii]|nr:MAG: hypothetical protein J3R72DRAFT_451738 [Linnemannia gamsii]
MYRTIYSTNRQQLQITTTTIPPQDDGEGVADVRLRESTGIWGVNALKCFKELHLMVSFFFPFTFFSFLHTNLLSLSLVHISPPHPFFTTLTPQEVQKQTKNNAYVLKFHDVLISIHCRSLSSPLLRRTSREKTHRAALMDGLLCYIEFTS